MNEDKWISVEDRLPELVENKVYSNDVLIICKNGIYAIAFLICANKEKWWTYNNKDNNIIYDVAYWQPLPDLPKELR